MFQNNDKLFIKFSFQLNRCVHHVKQGDLLPQSWFVHFVHCAGGRTGPYLDELTQVMWCKWQAFKFQGSEYLSVAHT
jgi:hypothetical protein